jgi:transcription elongation factor GreA
VPQFFMTQRGYEALQEKMRRLVEEEMVRAETRLGAAREMGDLAENAEYDAAREEIRLLEGKIAEIQDVLSNVHVVEPGSQAQDETGICCTVEIEEVPSGRRATWEIVGYDEGDVERGRISVYSPLGEALVGHKVGAVVEASLPAGKRTYKVVALRYPQQ